MNIIYILFTLTAVLLIVLLSIRLYDWHADQTEWSRLTGLQPISPLKFDPNSVRVTVSQGVLSQTVKIRVNTNGQPVEVSFLRWSNANSNKEYRFQPFGGKLSDFREVQGYKLPFKVEAGNMFGSDDYFAFYRAKIKEIHFLST